MLLIQASPHLLEYEFHGKPDLKDRFTLTGMQMLLDFFVSVDDTFLLDKEVCSYISNHFKEMTLTEFNKEHNTEGIQTVKQANDVIDKSQLVLAISTEADSVLISKVEE